MAADLLALLSLGHYGSVNIQFQMAGIDSVLSFALSLDSWPIMMIGKMKLGQIKEPAS